MIQQKNKSNTKNLYLYIYIHIYLYLNSNLRKNNILRDNAYLYFLYLIDLGYEKAN